MFSGTFWGIINHHHTCTSTKVQVEISTRSAHAEQRHEPTFFAPGSPNTTRKDRTIAWEKYRLPCSDGSSKKPETLLLNCVIDGEAYALTAVGITGTLGYEVLEGNSVQAFQTPLGTLHAFQGWADKFLATPADGIEDLYLSIATKIRGANISLIYHRFNPEAGGPDYGREWDLVIKKPLAERYSIVLKYTDYDARSFATDTEKFWFMATAKFGN